MPTPRSPGPLLLGVVLLIALCTTLLVAATATCGGQLVYALDDPYIHMAMARNLADHGVWGVTRYGFTSSSSSPLWTALLALAFWLGGARAGWPLVLNVLSALAVVVAAERSVRVLAPRAGRGTMLAVLAAVVLFTPLAPLVFTGQEHLLHAALSLVFALEAARAIEEPENSDADVVPRGWLLLAGLAIPLVATRYEGLFLAGAAALLLLSRGRRGLAWMVGLTALVPVLGYAMVSLSNDWFALPNPVLLKGNLADVSRFRTLVAGLLSGDAAAAAPDGWLQAGLDVSRLVGLTALEKLVSTPHMLVLVVAAVFLAGRRSGDQLADRGRALLMVFLGTTFLHLQFARTGWFYRYEAYLVAMGVVAVGCRLASRPARFVFSQPINLSGAAAAAFRSRRLRRTMIAALMVAPLLLRGLMAAYQLPGAASNVYEQQVQMGLFLGKHYAGAPVAVNDVGAVNWFADIQCLDMLGLASLDVCRRRMDLSWHRDAIDDITRRHAIRVAVVYDRWFDQQSTDGLPAQWERVATWRIRRNVANGEDTISFYAVRPGERPLLADALTAFRDRLPRTVRVQYDEPRR